VNFANTNARAILDMLGLSSDPPDGLIGSVEAEGLPDVHRRIMVCLNIENRRTAFIREEVHEGRVHMMDASDESIVYRLNRMLEVVVHGIRNKLPLFWD